MAATRARDVTERVPTSGRGGSILMLVLVVTVIAGILGVAMMTRTIRSARTGAWSRDHAVLRLLAESAVEELHLRLQLGANLPSDRTFLALRTAPPRGDAAPVALPWLRPDHLAADLKTHEQELGGRISLLPAASGQGFVHVTRIVPVSADPTERAGVVRFDVGLTLSSSRATVTERVSSERVFSIARAGLPRLPRLPGPLGTFSLLLGGTDHRTLPNFCPGAAAGPPIFVPSAKGCCTRVDGTCHTLLETLTRKAPDGLTAIPGACVPRLEKAMASLSPEALSSRAQFVPTSHGQLQGHLLRRLTASPPRSVDGVIYCPSTQALPVDFSRVPFRGRCLLAAAGPIHVFDVVLADPRVDSLTLVSASAIVVRGRSVQAALVCHGPGAQGVLFARRATVLGPVVSSRFPRSLGLSAAELGQCRIGSNPGLACLTSGSDATGEDPMASSVAAFSPGPLFLEHRRE